MSTEMGREEGCDVEHLSTQRAVMACQGIYRRQILSAKKNSCFILISLE
jgi:hypothetical protein